MTVQTHAPSIPFPTALPDDLSQTQVAHLARERPGSIRVFQRHRIDFCCGGKRTLAEAAERAGVALPALLGELVPALSGANRADAWLEQLPESLADLGKLIVGRYHVALRGELPRLVAMANRVETVHGAEMPEALPPLATEMRALAAELAEHMRDEEELLFPAIERVERATMSGERPDESDLAALVAAREDEHREAGARLGRMRELTGGFVPPDWACNTFRGLYFGLEELERELHEHIHLENNVLFPKAMALVGAKESVSCPV